MSAKSATKGESQALVPIPVLHATSAPPLPASYLGSATRDCSHPPPPSLVKILHPAAYDLSVTGRGRNTASALQVHALASSDVANSPPPSLRAGQPCDAYDGSSANILIHDARAYMPVITEDGKVSFTLQICRKVTATNTHTPIGPWSSAAAATAPVHHPHPRDTDKQRLDAGARMQSSQTHVVRHELRPLHSSMSKPTPMRRPSRLACAAAAVAAVIFACSAVGAVAASYSLGTWSTATLSAARGHLAATSLPNLGVAIFAGGFGMCCWYCLSCCMRRCFARGMHELQEFVVLSEKVCVCLTPCAAVFDNVPSKVVDILNVTAGTWSTATLSAARGYLAATSLPNLGVAIFAGGDSMCCWFSFELLHEALLCEGDARVAGLIVFVCVLHLVQQAVAPPMLWTS
jgi:hypothetical protein